MDFLAISCLSIDKTVYLGENKSDSSRVCDGINPKNFVSCS